jgi:hypothetical protein
MVGQFTFTDTIYRLLTIFSCNQTGALILGGQLTTQMHNQLSKWNVFSTIKNISVKKKFVVEVILQYKNFTFFFCNSFVFFIIN